MSTFDAEREASAEREAARERQAARIAAAAERRAAEREAVAEAAARIATVRQVRPQVEAQARARQAQGGRDKVPQKSAEAAETRDALATMAGVARPRPVPPHPRR